MSTDKTEEIATPNKLRRRRAIGFAGQLLLTEGIAALPEGDQLSIREKVRRFVDFREDTDPYNHRDFGAFDHAGRRVFWKIDYYGRTLTAGSEDPSKLICTTRVLTIMLASEY